MASVIRMATRAAASTALTCYKLVNLQRLQPIETLNPKIFVNGMYSARFHVSNVCLSNAVLNVPISERTLEVSEAEGEDVPISERTLEVSEAEGQDVPSSERTLEVSEAEGEDVPISERTLEVSKAEGEDEDLRSQGQNTPIDEATVRMLAKSSEIKQQLEGTRNEICKIIENDEKRMEEALTVMSTRLNSELVTMVLTSLNSLQLALRFFQWAKAQPGFKLNSAMYDELVNIAGRCKDFETLKLLLTERVADNCHNSAKTFSFATAWHDDAEMLGEVTETIKQLKNFARKNAYDMMVSALCKEDYVDSAISVLKDMNRAGCALTPSTFWPLLDAHGRNNRMAEVHEVFELMKKMSCPPDVTCYNFVLRKLYQNEQFAEADKFFKMMVNTYGCKPDHVTYDILVLGACRARKMEDAVRHFGRMKEDGLKPLHCTYTNLINGIFQLDGFEKAYAFVRQESGKNDPLDLNNYSFLIRSCIKVGNYREAHDVLMEMKAKNLKTDHRLCNEMLEKIS